MRLLCAPILLMAILCGCSDKEGSTAKKAGARVTETLTDFASGMGEGFDKKMEVQVELTEECAQAGLSKSVAKSLGMKQGISVYILADKPFVGNLLAKAYNAEGQEVGRVKVAVEFEADDAQYVAFPFDQEMDSQLVKKYSVDVRPQEASDSPAAASAETPADVSD